MEKTSMNGKEKAAIFLLSLDTKVAAEVIQNFSDEELPDFVEAMLAVQSMDNQMIDQVHTEYAAAMGTGSTPIGPVAPLVKEALTGAVGADECKEILSEINRRSEDLVPFQSFKGLATPQLVQLLIGEHPQTIALVLSHVDSDLSGQILSELPERLHADVVQRMAKTEQTPTELVKTIDSILAKKARALRSSSAASSSEARFKTVAEMLNVVGKNVRKNVLDSLSREDPDAAREIENLMFVFDDLAYVDDRAMQKIVREVESRDLATALKVASEEVKQKVLKNLSKRGAQNLEEEMEMLPPQPLVEIEEAQRRILDAAKRLEDAGDINIAQGGGDDRLI